MIVATLLGLSLVTSVALDSRPAQPPEASSPVLWPSLSVQQRDAALLPLVRRATDCILRKAAADKRLRGDIRPAAFNDLIIDSIAACASPVHSLVRAHDRLYGDGSGEAFLLGPYLDILPSAVAKQVRVRLQ